MATAEEELFESLASRCRPLLLDGDQIDMPAVLGSLRAVTRHDEARRKQIDIVRKAWGNALRPNAPDLIARAIVGCLTWHVVSHVVLAEQWLMATLF